ncbi:MAG TPA: SDR family NAD(P)-dependent oxidoreductase, partial [Candidatus Lustribacter sp.]|nr:SDR family NAD(P)-dependent oxidoreductase [Candidatus Lustribacter sp.]
MSRADPPPPEAFRHDGAVAIVTGASRGIGYGVAQRLVSEGARVVLTGRRPDALAEAVAALGGPERALGIAGNAADPEHQDEVIATTKATFGGIDYLVNNTGINPVYGPMLDTELEVARKILDVNVVSAFAWTQKAMHAGLGSARYPGAVVNVASIAGLGATALTRTRGASWKPSSVVRWMSAALETAYQPSTPVAPSPAIEATLTTAPG